MDLLNNLNLNGTITATLFERVEKIIFKNDFLLTGAVLMVFGLIASQTLKILQFLQDYADKKFFVKMVVYSDDEAYHWILFWLNTYFQKAKTTHFTVFTKRGNNFSPRYHYYGSQDDVKHTPTICFAPSPGWHIIRFKGNWISVNLYESFHKGQRVKEGNSITLRSYGNIAALKSLAEFAMNEALQNDLNKVTTFMSQQGYPAWVWKKGPSKAKRTIDSVILDGTIAEDIVAEVKEFFQRKEWYNARGIPHRLGYLLYGPPGCGKSSFILALASVLDLSICCLSLSSSGLDDSKLLELLQSAPMQSIVLIEDVDSAFSNINHLKTKSKKSNENASMVTFSGLLNALDGVVAHEGRLLFMTTNYKKLLNPALIRPGRVDRKIEFGHASKDQLYRLFMRFFFCDKNDEEKKMLQAQELSKKFSEKVPDNRASAALIQSFFLRYKDAPEKALANIPELMTDLEEEEKIRTEDEKKKQKELEEIDSNATAKNKESTDE